MTSCLFIDNSKKFSVNEGSMQLNYGKVDVSKCKILNQKGYGIVLQFGIGEFKDMNVACCVSGGFLIQAPSLIRNCIIENCSVGISVCEKVNGDVNLKGNKFTRCKIDYISSTQEQSVKVDGKYQPCSIRHLMNRGHSGLRGLNIGKMLISWV